MGIKEIAKLAGVSPMTVSNVINKRYSKVSMTTVEKVNKIIKEKNYIPNLSARTLSAQTSKIIAIIVPRAENEECSNFFSDPYISQMVGILETKLRSNGYFAMIRSVTSSDGIITFLNNWKIDGAIFILPNGKTQLNSIIKKIHVPSIFMDSYTKNQNVCTININDYKGGFIATEYLIKNNHKNIAFISPINTTTPLIEQRFKGYSDALKQYNIPLRKELLIQCDISYEEGLRIGDVLKAIENISAAVTTADIIALGIIDRLRENNINVPQDFSVTGYDNLTFSKYGYPKITTIDQHIEEKGAMAIELLFDRINKTNRLTNKICVDVELVERDSVKKLVNN
ncbi:MAG: LacI family DNA-binding transcriptional regulator [Spirochaetaceae bacterium]|nr:LacI family DNA-binding transcriptional regulator [Spirochaetaceae bacterium]